MVAVITAYIFAPVFTAPWHNPRILLSLSGWGQLFAYAVNTIPGYFAALCVVVAHVLPPSFIDATHETPALREALISFFTKMLQDRPNLAFDEVGSASYVVRM